MINTPRQEAIFALVKWLDDNEPEVYVTEHEGRVVLIMDHGTAALVHEMVGSTTIRGRPRERTNLVYNKLDRNNKELDYPYGLAMVGCGIFNGTLSPETDVPTHYKEGM